MDQLHDWFSKRTQLLGVSAHVYGAAFEKSVLHPHIERDVCWQFMRNDSSHRVNDYPR